MLCYFCRLNFRCPPKSAKNEATEKGNAKTLVSMPTRGEKCKKNRIIRALYLSQIVQEDAIVQRELYFLFQ